MNPIVAQLDDLSPTDFTAWLREALCGRIPGLPRIDRDETPSTSLALLAKQLQGITLRKFEAACIELARVFSQDPGWSESGFEDQLLLLLGSLRLLEASLPLEQLAGSFPDTALDPEGQMRVLHAIHDIGRRSDADFWTALAHRQPDQFAVIAFSALLRFGHRQEALALLGLFPDRADFATATGVHLQLAYRRLDAEGQRALLEAAAARLNECQPAVRAALERWLTARVYRHSIAAPATQESSDSISFLRNRFPGPSQLAVLSPKLPIAA